MPEPRRRCATDEPGQAKLTSRRIEQIDTANDVGYPLRVIVDGHGELIGPVTEAVAHQHVPTLPAGVLFLRAQQFVEEALGAGIHAHAPTDTLSQWNVAVPAGARIHIAWNVGPSARAAEHQLTIDQRLQRLAVDRVALALPDHGAVGREAEPRQVFEDRGLVFRPRALPIVVFDP